MHAMRFPDSRVAPADTLVGNLPAGAGMVMPRAAADGVMAPQAQAGRF